MLQRQICNVQPSNIILLHIFFRHGHRTPTTGFSYKTDPYKDYPYEPYGPGQLTNTGKLCSYRLGESVRRKYINFLGSYVPGCVDAITTACERTQASLQLFLAGLYPPEGELIWNKHLMWQPIPYGCEDPPLDKVLTTCFRNEKFEKLHCEHQKMLGIQEKNKELFAFLSEKLDMQITGLHYVWHLYIKLLTQKEFGLTLPEWTSKVFPKPLEDLAVCNYQTQMVAAELRTIAISKLVEKVIEDTNLKIANKSAVKLHAYSAHELNIAQLLIGLNSFIPPHLPDYSACVIFEIREDKKDDISIAVLYKANTNEEPKYLPLWGKNPCSFNVFAKLIREENFK